MVLNYRRSAHVRRAAARAAAMAPPVRRRLPPSADLVSAVLEWADLRDELGGGKVMLRLSPMRLAHADLRRQLGDEAERAGDVAVIWDEREDEIVRVLDGGPAPLTLVQDDDDAFAFEAAEEDGLAFGPDEDEPQFELTPAALQYLAESGSRRRW
jgi:hypothetical protein